MDHYLEIRLLPDPEFQPTVLMSALYSKLHRALVQLENPGLGVSFPDIEQACPTLGKRLRLHGKHENLQRLMALNWLTGMRDHTSVGELTPTPDNVDYRVVRRVQAKSNPERLRRRLAKRRGISLEEAQKLIPDSYTKQLTLPFVTIRSQSTGQTFRLFIDHLPPQSAPVPGKFSHYGLSPTATVPWF